MPLLFEKIISAKAKIRVWKIAESESFFSEKTGTDSAIKNQGKRMQHLAGRFLLKGLIPGLTMDEIIFNESGKPESAGCNFHFSISHCSDYAAVIISGDQKAGLDIECLTPKAAYIRSKFLTNEEEGILSGVFENMTAASTIGWCIKESVYKWAGKNAVDFKKQIQIESLHGSAKEFAADCRFLKGEEVILKASGMMIDNLVLCWVLQ